jgi:hypothetical protein
MLLSNPRAFSTSRLMGEYLPGAYDKPVWALALRGANNITELLKIGLTRGLRLATLDAELRAAAHADDVTVLGI